MFEHNVVVDVDSHWELPRAPEVAGNDPTERIKSFVAASRVMC